MGWYLNSLTYSVLICGVLRKRDDERGKELMCSLWETMKDEEDHSVNSAAFSNIIDSLCREGFLMWFLRFQKICHKGRM